MSTDSCKLYKWGYSTLVKVYKFGFSSFKWKSGPDVNVFLLEFYILKQHL